jgi:hypothetical protein
VINQYSAVSLFGSVTFPDLNETRHVGRISYHMCPVNLLEVVKQMVRLIIILTFILPIHSKAQTIAGDPIYDVLPMDKIPAILVPEFVTAGGARQIMTAEEQVLGLIGPEGTAVAYSTWHLDHHEIVNDLVDGLPLAVTW